MNIIIADIQKRIYKSIDLETNVSDEAVEEMIEKIVFLEMNEENLTMQERKYVIDAVFNAIRRLGVLQPLIDDESITEIMVNGHESIFVEREGATTKLDAKFESQKKLEDVIQTIVAKVNRVVNESSPIVDARLSDGSRINVVLPPVALNGPILTIRKFRKDKITIEDLIETNSITKEVAKFLEDLVKAKYNIFVCGGTGSGKTTFLNALSNLIPKDERIITIEDSAELQIRGIQNLVTLETRNANTEGKGRITIRDLIKSSLRMRPDRIIVGEVRGEEAIDMLQAMNTGHDGSLSTGHSNSTKDMISRLETMVLSGTQMPIEAIRQQIGSAIDIIINLSRLRDKTRKVLEISEVLLLGKDEIRMNPLYVFEEVGLSEQNKIVGELIRTESKMQKVSKFRLAGIKVMQ
ncbi:MAG: pilus assembly protein [Alkaliphilus sp.]|nr:CpaF family protein [bacterium AH-315-K05]PHS29964.1 MAG: pilus assembly protein [Alkaliphilus sp.]